MSAYLTIPAPLAIKGAIDRRLLILSFHHFNLISLTLFFPLPPQ